MSLQGKIETLQTRSRDLANVKEPTSNVASLQTEMANADKTNRWIRKAKEIKENIVLAKNYSDNYNEKTKKIEMIDTHKQNVLKNAQMPLKELALTDDCVTYGDRPFDQLSTSQQMKVSIAICQLMMDPKKETIILIREGNLLDDKSLAVIEEMAKKYSGYYIIEYVLKKGEKAPYKNGILIQEGRVISVDGEPVKK